MMQKTVGVFLTEREAAEAVEELKRSGYQADDISVITRNRENAEEMLDQHHNKAPEGAAGGAAAGGILGGVGGLLVGLGALAIPGIGPLLAAGPIAVSLAGLAVGATSGGLVGGLIGLGIPEEDAKMYDEHVGGGRVLVIVETENDKRSELESIFRNHYALNHTRLGGTDDSGHNMQAIPPHQKEIRSDPNSPMNK
ncbi:general stress protein [Saccharibacillus sp. JS10]|uniref:general stress protein n=1 Tax=Saccharibacillus sp. JS10 TaxID=2950552 RepID=UPI00210CE3A0|nr:general stress protein [Saccharibacillus sp. JS10]MCQ4088351.1 general stress protein [Saccharibacillus sp. JS10]